MSSNFNARNAANYEQIMGRWSKRLARPFIEFSGVKDGERIVDVGCGTGSLTFALPQMANVKSIVGVDYSPVFVEQARALNADKRITIAQGDATDLKFPDATFDRAFAMLVLHFVREPERAIAEMKRVVRPGGVVSAAVWDGYGGLNSIRMVWETAALLDPQAVPGRNNASFRPMSRPGEMKQAFERQGLKDVTQSSITIRMDYDNFADYWTPHAEGEGSAGPYIVGLDPDRRARLEQALRSAYESGQPDGPRSFAAVAWVCRGVV
jgi:SAM-dependent methyltransferase